MNRHITFAAIGLMTAGFAGAHASPAAAQSGTANFADKRISLVVGHQAGGGYDAYARIFARHYGRFLPSKPSVIVQNMPGGGGVKAANNLYNVAPRDGTGLGMFASSAAFAPLYGNKKAQFETSKFGWIGNMDETTSTCAVWNSSGIKTFDDMFKKEVKFGGVSQNSITSQHGFALKNITGAKIKIVQGYKGSPEINLAMQRGEVQGGCGLALTTLKARYWDDVKSGRLKPIVQLAFEKHPELPGVAHIYDFAKSGDDRQVIDLVFGSNIIGRPIAAPPSLNEGLLKQMRAAFMTMAKDKDFLADAAKAKINITVSSGEKLESLFTRFFKYPPEVIKRAKEAVQG